jgi:hypothetical protein
VLGYLWQPLPRTKFPVLELRAVETLAAVYDRRPVCFASSRVFHRAQRRNPPHLGGFRRGKSNPKLNQILPFRERLGCSPREACAALGVGRTFFYSLIAERRVEVRKLGRRTIVSIPSLIKLLDAQASEAKPRRSGRPRKTAGVVAS